MTKVDTLTAKRAELESQETVEAGWAYVPTGETFGEFWEGLTPEGRNDYLRDNGLHVTMTRTKGEQPTFEVDVSDLAGMVERVYPGHYAETADKLHAVGLDGDDPNLVLTALDRVPRLGAL